MQPRQFELGKRIHKLWEYLPYCRELAEGVKMLDDDGDGSVSSAEFSSQMQDDFAAADKDGDGILN